jgi:pyruvate,water dikinase
MVEWLDETEADAGRLGGKAASLARLARSGFRIPPGFCLTTDAFEAQVAGLPGAGVVRADPATLLDEPTRTGLVEAMLRGPLAPGVAEALIGPLARLARFGGGVPGPDGGATSGPDGEPMLLAVRSSGVAEDGATASFAGLHDTELGLTAGEVPAAILRCWASLWSDRAIGYRTRRGLALDGGAMAVVVQALVPADASAVVMTRHPVTGRSDVLLINAVRGLGEAMVSGTVTPHSILVDKASLRVIEFEAGEAAAGSPLESAIVAELVGRCLDVERAFGAPMDIEAAHAADGWYLLQARPITGGAPA